MEHQDSAERLAPRERRAATLHGEIVNNLRDYVVEGDIAVGARVPERALCERFGVSRTPLREALKVLAAEGLIELLPNRGARVKALSIEEMSELFDLLGGLEALAGRLACERIVQQDIDKIEGFHREMYRHYLRGDRHEYFKYNQMIHECILEIADNRALTEAARALSSRLRRARYAANLDGQGERWSEAVREHEQILEALRRRNGNDIATILFNHLRNKKAAVLRNLPEHNDGNDDQDAGRNA